MKPFTFAIITDWEDPRRVLDVVENITNLSSWRDHEILVVGGEHDFLPWGLELDNPKVKLLPMKGSWITEKKNIAAWQARYNNIVMMHDYFLLDEGWHTGYEEFGDDWDICSNPQLLMTGKRHFTDWVLWDHPELPRYHSLDYWDWSKTQYQYISGGYFLVKRHVLLDQPFNTKMKQGEPEDVEWSLRVRDKYKIRCNPYSIVRHNKMHRDAKNSFY
jgi:hypothetical protein